MFGPDIIKLWVWHRNLTQLLAQSRRQLSSHWRRAGPALPVTIDRGKLTPDSDIRSWCCYSSRCSPRSTVWKSDSFSLQAPSMQDLQTLTTNNPMLSTDVMTDLSLSSQYCPCSRPVASTPLFSRFSNLFPPSPSMLSWSVCFLSYSLPSVLTTLCSTGWEESHSLPQETRFSSEWKQAFSLLLPVWESWRNSHCWDTFFNSLIVRLGKTSACLE